MIIDALNYSLTNFNGVIQPDGPIQLTALAATTTVVNDQNFIERILRFLRRVRLIDRNIHFDQDRDSVGDVVDNLDQQLNSRIDFILPADQELVSLIINEVNNAIRRIVAKAVDKIMEIKKTRLPDIGDVTGILAKEIDAANEVINDLVARKIATLLSAHDVPPKPYTPLINTIAISYISSKELIDGEDRFFHILPFGTAEIYPLAAYNPGEADNTIPVPINKMFPSSIIPSPINEATPSGILFIGIKELALNENLSLFFQIDQGTKRSDKRPPNVNWWYLKDNEWIILKNDFIIADSTYGLQITGIVELAVPQNINNWNTVFDEAGLFLVSASRNQNAKRQLPLINRYLCPGCASNI